MARRLYNQLIPMWSSMHRPLGLRSGPGSPFRLMEQQLQAMEKHMNDMFSEFGQVGHIHPANEQETFKNPIVTEPDGTKKMQLHFDVRHFKPEEVSVKTQNNVLTVHAKHENKNENSTILREYHRQFTLPEGIESERMTSLLSPDGVLTIEAPLPKSSAEDTEPKSIPIEHIKDKDN